MIGIVSDMLKERWKDSNFQLSKEELLEVVPTIIDDALAEEKRRRMADKEKARQEKLARKRKSEGTWSNNLQVLIFFFSWKFIFWYRDI